MHPLRKLRESGNPTPAQVGELLAKNIVFNSPILVRPIEGREVIAAIFAQSSSTRGSGTYTAEFKRAVETYDHRLSWTSRSRNSTYTESAFTSQVDYFRIAVPSNEPQPTPHLDQIERPYRAFVICDPSNLVG